jgi:hypothetical protein
MEVERCSRFSNFYRETETFPTASRACTNECCSIHCHILDTAWQRLDTVDKSNGLSCRDKLEPADVQCIQDISDHREAGRGNLLERLSLLEITDSPDHNASKTLSTGLLIRLTCPSRSSHCVSTDASHTIRLRFPELCLAKF